MMPPPIDKVWNILAAIIAILAILVVVLLIALGAGCSALQGWAVETAGLAAREAVEKARTELVQPTPLIGTTDAGLLSGVAAALALGMRYVLRRDVKKVVNGKDK
jgi:hypothetical protein